MAMVSRLLSGQANPTVADLPRDSCPLIQPKILAKVSAISQLIMRWHSRFDALARSFPLEKVCAHHAGGPPCDLGHAVLTTLSVPKLIRRGALPSWSLLSASFRKSSVAPRLGRRPTLARPRQRRGSLPVGGCG